MIKRGFRFSNVLFVFLSLLLLGAAFVFFKLRPVKAELRLDGPEPYFIAAGFIFNKDLEVIRNLDPEAYLCLPLADGGWISATDLSLTRRKPDGAVIWQRKGFFSHQIRIIDNDYLLGFFYEVKKVNGERVKFDLIEKLDLKSGKTLKTFSIYDYFFNKAKLSPFQSLFDSQDKMVLAGGARREASHFNSISITENNVYISDLRLPTLILTHELEFKGFNNFFESRIWPQAHGPLKWALQYRGLNSFYKNPPLKPVAPEDHSKHDLQFSDDNSKLVFVNRAVDSEHLKTFRIYEFRGSELVFQFPTDPEDYIESSCCGGVEKINDFYLVGARAADLRSSFIGWVTPDGHWLIKKMIPFSIQEIKKIPYDNFLELNQIR